MGVEDTVLVGVWVGVELAVLVTVFVNVPVKTDGDVGVMVAV